MQFPSGLLADRFGMARTITGGILLAGIASALLAVTQSFIALLVGASVIGIGTGSYKTVGIKLITVLYEDHQGFSLGTMDTVGMFGGVVAPAVVGVALSARAPWRLLFLASAGVSIGLAVLFYRLTTRRLDDVHGSSSGEETDPDPETPGDGRDDERSGVGSEQSYRQVLFEPYFAAFVLLNALFTFTWGGFSSFLPLYLIQVKGFSTGLASLLYSGLFIVGVVQVVTGELSDRIGQLRIIVATVVLVTGTAVMLLAASSTLVIVGLVLVLGLGFHGIRPPRDSYLMELIPVSVGGGVLGIVRTVLAGVAAAAPAIVGFLSDIVNMTFAFVVLLAAVVLALLIGTGLLVHDHRASSPAIGGA
jgi:MFS family permease